MVINRNIWYYITYDNIEQYDRHHEKDIRLNMEVVVNMIIIVTHIREYIKGGSKNGKIQNNVKNCLTL